MTWYQTMTRKFKRDPMWHSTKVAVIISPFGSSPMEAQCSCGWSLPCPTYEAAKGAGMKHLDGVEQ